MRPSHILGAVKFTVLFSGHSHVKMYQIVNWMLTVFSIILHHFSFPLHVWIKIYWGIIFWYLQRNTEFTESDLYCMFYCIVNSVYSNIIKLMDKSQIGWLLSFSVSLYATQWPGNNSCLCRDNFFCFIISNSFYLMQDKVTCGVFFNIHEN